MKVTALEYVRCVINVIDDASGSHVDAHFSFLLRARERESSARSDPSIDSHSPVIVRSLVNK